jgi:hypothetical protein
MLACICKDQPLQAIDLTLSTTKFSEMTGCPPAFLAIDHKDKQKSYPYISLGDVSCVCLAFLLPEKYFLKENLWHLMFLSC